MSMPVTEKQRFYEIDLLRFLAALSVVFFHYTFRGFAANDLSPLEFPALGQITKYGYLGVDLFFIISGFVISMTAQNRSVIEFFISRITRLFPAYWIAVSLTAVTIYLLGEPRFTVTISEYLYNLTMVSGFFGVSPVDGVYWSLLVELKFYLLILLLILTRQVHWAKYYLGVWFAFVISCHVTSVPQILKDLLFRNWATYFISGATFYLIRIEGFSFYNVGLLHLSYGLAIYNATALDGVIAFYKTDMSQGVVAGIITSFYLSFLLIVTGKASFLNRKAFVSWGALTYPLYLIHQNIGYIAFQIFNSEKFKYFTLVIMLGLILLCSYAFHSYWKRPFGRWLKRFLETHSARFRVR